MEFPLDVNAIQECIPHRHPFLLIDRVIEAVPNERILALRSVSNSHPELQGHFPGNPVVPGVLIVESMAQAAGVLGHLSNENGLTTCLLTEVSSARFRKPVIPGDTMNIEVLVERQRVPFYWFKGFATVDGEKVAEVKFSALMR